MVAAAVIGSAVVGGVLSSQAQGDAADTAAGAQTATSGAQIAESRRQFEAIRELLKPYADAGLKSIGAQQDLIGLNGAQPQQDAITGLQNSPLFTSMTKTGEDAILQNASATGNLRGGNVQRALSQYRPALLAQLIESQYGKLGGITSIGQNAAAGTGNAGMQTTNAINAALGEMGAAQAGGALAQGRANAGLYNSLGGGVGMYGALGRFGGGGATDSYADIAGAGSRGFIDPINFGSNFG